MSAHRGRTLILLAVAIGLLLRLGFGLMYWAGKPLTQDEREYLALAESLAAGQGFVYPETHETGTGQKFSRAPGYPALLAAVGAGTSAAAPARVKVLNALLGAVSIWLIAMLAWAVGGPSAGAVAAALAAVYPPLVWLPAYVFSESLYMPLALGCVLLLVRVEGRLGSPDGGAVNAIVIAAGLVAGSAALVRSAMLVFIPLGAVWLASRRRVALALAFAICAAVVVAPWTLRNLRVHGRPIVVAADGGVTFWTGNHPLAIGEGDLAANPRLKAAEIAFRREQGTRSAEELEPLYYRDALQRIREDPGWWLGLVAAKAFYTIVPIGPSYTLHSPRYLMASVVSYLLIAPLGCAGLLRMSRRRGVPLVLLVVSVIATALIFFPQERFRIPVLDPALLVGTSIMIAGARSRQ